jgi:nucleoid-associated protein YgaU
MTRYNPQNNVKTRFDGRRFLGTRLYPTITESDSDVLYITNDTDYLDTLAHRFYKDKSLWWIIALANNLGNGRLSITGGLQLRIPMRIEEIVSRYNRINS